MKISPATKIAALLKAHPSALNALVSISPRFEKLRNPLLRKMIAGRATISMAAKVGGVEILDFYEKLKPLGFIVDETIEDKKINNLKMEQNEFIRSVNPEMIIDLDVRSVLAGGTDPFHIILEAVNNLKQGQVLRIINTFAPMPLVTVLSKKGYESYIDQVELQLVYAYFYKKGDVVNESKVEVKDVVNAWNEIAERFKDNMSEIDVRQLEMPQPMHKILESLDQLPVGKALFVRHKRLPVFLLPELAEKKFEYRLNEKGEGDVEMIIFRP